MQNINNKLFFCVLSIHYGRNEEDDVLNRETKNLSNKTIFNDVTNYFYCFCVWINSDFCFETKQTYDDQWSGNVKGPLRSELIDEVVEHTKTHTRRRYSLSVLMIVLFGSPSKTHTNTAIIGDNNAICSMQHICANTQSIDCSILQSDARRHAHEHMQRATWFNTQIRARARAWLADLDLCRQQSNTWNCISSLPHTFDMLQESFLRTWNWWLMWNSRCIRLAVNSHSINLKCRQFFLLA